MKKAVPIAALLAGVLALSVPLHPQQPPPQGQQEQEPQPPIRVGADLVNIVFSVVNRRGRFVTDLERDNFRVFEDGEEQKLEFFSRETDLPLRIGLLLDTSNSIRSRMQFQQEAAIHFLHNVVRRNKDMAFLMTFDSEPAIIHDFTDNLNDLQEAILRQRAGGGTALYDAIHFACRQRMLQPPLPEGENREVRRILVMISDGVDTVISGHSLGQAVEMAQRAGVSIYAISTSTDWLSLSGTTPKKVHFTEGDKILMRLADETGGRAFYPYRAEDLAQSFYEIGDELRSQYSLAYVPTNRAADGRFREIEIKVNRRGLQVRARKGYYAPLPSDATRASESSPDR